MSKDRLDEDELNNKHGEYLTALALNAFGSSAMDAAIAEDIRKDDSYLHGKIVYTNKEAEQRQREQEEAQKKKDTDESAAQETVQNRPDSAEYASSSDDKKSKGKQRAAKKGTLYKDTVKNR